MGRYSAYNRLLPTLLVVSFILQVGSVPHLLSVPIVEHGKQHAQKPTQHKVEQGHPEGQRLEKNPSREQHEAEGEPDHIDPEALEVSVFSISIQETQNKTSCILTDKTTLNIQKSTNVVSNV